MSIQYNFEDLEGLASYLDADASNRREQALIVKRVGDRNQLLDQAAMLEWIATMVRQSDIYQGRLIMVDDDLGEAHQELVVCRRAVELAAEELNVIVKQIEDRITALNKETAQSGH